MAEVSVTCNPDINTSRLTPERRSSRSLVKGYLAIKGYTNEISVSGNEMRFEVNYKDEKGEWYRKRTSVAEAKTLSPIKYKSEGLKNSVELKFGNNITGTYKYLNGGGKDKQILFKAELMAEVER